MSVDGTELIAPRCQLELINVVITNASDEMLAGWLADEYMPVVQISFQNRMCELSYCKCILKLKT